MLEPRQQLCGQQMPKPKAAWNKSDYMRRDKNPPQVPCNRPKGHRGEHRHTLPSAHVLTREVNIHEHFTM